MESFEVLLLLLGCVMLSSVFDQVLPRVSLPLVQIGLGIVVGFAVVANPTDVFLDPELFLLIFIAPLLFDEARHADKVGLWNNLGAVASLAIGLVFLTVLIVGFVLNWIVPSIPLAAAFALGAALGPTDAVAVAALGKEVSLSDRQKSLLSGEALINDASGVVSFEFAVAAAVTGAFSLVDASVSFVVDFFGGIALGLVFAAVVMFVIKRVRLLGLETTTVYVLLEVCTPFVAFLLAESLDVSGVLAVVAAGLLMKFYPNQLTLESSRYAVASENVWELLVYAINGVVFVLLGMMLPEVILPTWNASGSEGGVWLIGLIVLITAIVVGVRFAWVLAMDCYAAKRERNAQAAAAGAAAGGEAAGAPERPGRPVATAKVLTADLARQAMVTTLSGPKGAVTLSIVLSLPYAVSSGDAFPNRDLLIFLASGTIVLTLLLANFVVPLLAPSEEGDEDDAARAVVEVEILLNVIKELEASKTPETERMTDAVIEEYRRRMNMVREQEVSDERLREMRLQVLHAQLDFVKRETEGGGIDPVVAERYASALERRIGVYESWGRRKVRKVAQYAPAVLSWATHFLSQKLSRTKLTEQQRSDLSLLIEQSERFALEYLEGIEGGLDAEGKHAVGILKSGRMSRLAALDTGKTTSEGAFARSDTELHDMREMQENPSVREAMSAMKHVKATSRDIEAEALSIELEQIQQMREAGKLSPADARELREEVYLLQMGLEAR